MPTLLSTSACDRIKIIIYNYYKANAPNATTELARRAKRTNQRFPQGRLEHNGIKCLSARFPIKMAELWLTPAVSKVSTASSHGLEVTSTTFLIRSDAATAKGLSKYYPRSVCIRSRKRVQDSSTLRGSKPNGTPIPTMYTSSLSRRNPQAAFA